MNWRNAWDSLQEWMAAREQAGAVAAFSCGQCKHNASCARPPSDDCIEKLDQIAAGQDWRYRPAAPAGQRRHFQY
jgi:hypothetical protein